MQVARVMHFPDDGVRRLLLAKQLNFIYANHLHIRYLTVSLVLVNPIKAPE